MAVYEIMLNRNFQRFFKFCGMFVSYVALLVRQKEKFALEWEECRTKERYGAGVLKDRVSY